MNLVKHLTEQKLISPPAWLPDNCAYLTIMGSIAYGVADTNDEGVQSDYDLYGFCLPPREVVFPHLGGAIWGFGKYKSGMPENHFQQYQQHHVHDPTARAGKGRDYDLTIFNIVKYFQLCMECNPNVIDSLFTPEWAVQHSTGVGQLVRENRKLFLHQGICDRFKGYAFSQIHKMSTKEPEEGSKRAAIREKFGFDVKFGYHVVRLLCEAEQLLLEGDLDLLRPKEMLKSIRRGEWTEDQIREFFEQKRKELDDVRAKSVLPPKPDENAIRNLLVQCLEAHYGSLEGAVKIPERAENLIRQMKEMMESAGY